MATLQEACITAEQHRRTCVVRHAGEPVYMDAEGVFRWKDGEPVEITLRLLDGWTIEEPKPQTEDWLIADNGYGFLNATRPGTETWLNADCCPADMRFIGYVPEGLEDLPDDELPQQLRVWVRTSAVPYDDDLNPSWLAVPARLAFTYPNHHAIYELRTAKAVRMRKEE